MGDLTLWYITVNTCVPWEDDMEFIDIGVTAAIVLAAFIYTVRHIMAGKKGCSSCTGCSKAGNCSTAPMGIGDTPPSRDIQNNQHGRI